jgi:eukaryotic-like serine/threonine-protein kinase
LGVTCIHLLTQVSPFDLFDLNRDAWVWKDYLVNNPVDEELGRVLDRMIANSLPQRYQSATAVLAALGEPSPDITNKATLQNSKTSDDEFEQVLQSLDRMLSDSSPQQYKSPTGVSTALESLQGVVIQESIPQNSKTLGDEDLARISDFKLDNFTQTPVKPLNNQPALQSFEFETAKIRIEELGGLWGHTKVVIEKSRGQSKQFVEDFGDGVSLSMVAIPGGSFLMGSPESELAGIQSYIERPQHQVQVPPFYMSKYVITVSQYQTVMSGRSHELDLPMTCKWGDAVSFCEKLSKGLQRNYRLPFEAEWEYACRAGTTTPFYCGETIDSELANYCAWMVYGRGQSSGNSLNDKKKVGSYPANEYGLYDMHGNVEEWCADSRHPNYIDAPTNSVAWISSNNNERVVRGGGGKSSPERCRSAARKRVEIDSYHPGFRVVCC